MAVCIPGSRRPQRTTPLLPTWQNGHMTSGLMPTIRGTLKKEHNYQLRQTHREPLTLQERSQRYFLFFRLVCSVGSVKLTRPANTPLQPTLKSAAAERQAVSQTPDRRSFPERYSLHDSLRSYNQLWMRVRNCCSTPLLRL